VASPIQSTGRDAAGSGGARCHQAFGEAVKQPTTVSADTPPHPLPADASCSLEVVSS
jgi:hypothetical protein